jgi:hypothetical protein
MKDGQVVDVVVGVVVALAWVWVIEFRRFQK